MSQQEDETRSTKLTLTCNAITKYRNTRQDVVIANLVGYQ